MSKLGKFKENECCVNDSVSMTVPIKCYHLNAPTSMVVWENKGDFYINGTILVENPTSSRNCPIPGKVELCINDVSVRAIEPGQSFAITVENLRSISIKGTKNSVPTTKGPPVMEPPPCTLDTEVKVSFSINYLF